MTLSAFFLPFKIISHTFTSIYLSLSYLAHFLIIVEALRYGSSFSVQIRSVTQNMKMGEKSTLNVINDVKRVFWHSNSSHYHITQLSLFIISCTFSNFSRQGLLYTAVVFPCKDIDICSYMVVGWVWIAKKHAQCR